MRMMMMMMNYSPEKGGLKNKVIKTCATPFQHLVFIRNPPFISDISKVCVESILRRETLLYCTIHLEG